MRFAARLAALTVATAALTACGSEQVSTPGAGSTTSPSTTAPSGTTEPVEPTGPHSAPRGLVGLWQVSRAGEPAGTVLRLSADQLSLVRPCGVLSGDWAADTDGTLLTHVTDGPAACRTGTELTPGWLVPPGGVKPDGKGGWLVNDREGTVVAQLTRTRDVTLPPGADQGLATPPTLDADAERRLAPAVPLPTGLEAATSRSIAGAWGPAKATSKSGQPATLQLQDSGEWVGTDGCNTTKGRWTTGSDGRVLVTGGASTMIGCDNVPLPLWWQDAARAGLDGEQLVLLDAQGKEIARLVRVPSRPGLTTHATPGR